MTKIKRDVTISIPKASAFYQHIISRKRTDFMTLDDVKKLHQKKYRNQFGYYLVEGEHLILELEKALHISNSHHTIKVYVTHDNEKWAGRLSHHFSLQCISHQQMQRISDTKTPQGIIACVPLPELGVDTAQNTRRNESSKAQYERCVYLHEIQDPGNLGTILRTLAWFGHFRLLLSPNSVDPYNPKVVRASMGAIFHVPLELDVNISALQTRFERFAYLDMSGKPINSSDFSWHDCYLFGNEARGVPHDSLLQCKAEAFTIFGSGNIDSLNVASAVNICAYQLSL